MSTENILYHFSPAISVFIERCNTLLKNIIRYEVKFEVLKKRFVVNNTTYPINLIAFEHKSKLGYFCSVRYEIGINKSLMIYEDDSLKELLRHEFAHYLTFIIHGNTQPPHCKEFKNICKLYKWNEELNATIDINNLKIQKDQSIIKKVQKLLELSSSSNLHEANNAMEKARELLLKYRLSYTNDDELYVSKRLIAQRKITAKLTAILDIICNFLVCPVYCFGAGAVYLEIFGRELHVEIAEYVVAFLNYKLDELWESEKKKRKGKMGPNAKGSFLSGIANGFNMKMKENITDSNALTIVNSDLNNGIKLAYQQLTTNGRSCSNYNEDSFNNGQAIGKNLTIHSSIAKNSECAINLIN